MIILRIIPNFQIGNYYKIYLQGFIQIVYIAYKFLLMALYSGNVVVINTN